MGAFKGIKKILPRTLFVRSLLILITPIILIQAITTFIFLDRHWNSVSARLAGSVSGEIALITDRVSDYNDPLQLAWIKESVVSHLDIDVTYRPDEWIEMREEVSSYKFWERILLKTMRRELSVRIRDPFSIHVSFPDKYVFVDVQLQDGALHFSVPQRRLFTSTSYIFLLWMFGSSLLLLIVAVLFMRGQVRPIRKLAVAAERFGKGRDVTNFKPSGAREVRQAAKAFEKMRGRIRRQIEQRTAMLAGVSHDLRTPITRLKLQLGMMEENADIIAMKDDLYAMEHMINGYLDFVRSNAEEESVELDLRMIILGITQKTGEAKINFVSSKHDFTITARPLSLRRAVGNIIENALKYGENVWISLDRKAGQDDDQFIIQIEDDGPGIAEELYGDVFKPFYRVEGSRNSATGGVGLGLAIAQDSIQYHGGEIKLMPSHHGGLKVLISLPV